MAELAAITGATLFTVKADSVALVRGVRVTLDTAGTCAASAIGVRGDFVTTGAVAAAAVGAMISMQEGAIVPALASEATTVGAAAYSAASGKFSVTSTSAVLVGKWVLAASGDNVLGEVLLGNPA